MREETKERSLMTPSERLREKARRLTDLILSGSMFIDMYDDNVRSVEECLLSETQRARDEVRSGIVQILDDYPDITVDDLARIKNEIYEKYPESEILLSPKESENEAGKKESK